MSAQSFLPSSSDLQDKWRRRESNPRTTPTVQRNTHRWPRATTHVGNYGRICECGNLKTDQALTCFDCAVERRTKQENRTCPKCGGFKSRGSRQCLRCKHEAQVGVSVASGRAQEQSHPWRKAT